jgi:hypothetical protein
MSFHPENIIASINNERRSTLLLIILGRTNAKIENFCVVSLNSNYFEIEVSIANQVEKMYIKVFHKEKVIDDLSALKKMTELHENSLFLSFPKILPGLLATFIWAPLPLCSIDFQNSFPDSIHPYLPSTKLAAILTALIFLIHAIEALIVSNILIKIKVSKLTIFVWAILTIWFGYLQTEKALLIRNFCRLKSN